MRLFNLLRQRVDIQFGRIELASLQLIHGQLDVGQPSLQLVDRGHVTLILIMCHEAKAYTCGNFVSSDNVVVPSHNSRLGIGFEAGEGSEKGEEADEDD